MCCRHVFVFFLVCFVLFCLSFWTWGKPLGVILQHPVAHGLPQVQKDNKDNNNTRGDINKTNMWIVQLGFPEDSSRIPQGGTLEGPLRFPQKPLRIP